MDVTTDELFSNAEGEVTSSKMNNAFASIVIQPDFVSDKSTVTPAGGDLALIYDVSTSGLAKCTFTSVFTVLIPSYLGTSSTTAAAGNDTRFPASVTGVRLGAGVGSNDLAATPVSYAAAPTAGTLVTGPSPDTVGLNCAIQNHFTVTLGADNCTITLNSIADGDTISVLTTQDSVGSRTILFAIGTGGYTLKWVGGSQPASTNAANTHAIWTFKRFGANVYGTGDISFTA